MFVFSTASMVDSQSLSLSSRSQEDKVADTDADVDDASERVGEFTVWFDDFARFDQQLHLLIDLGIFTDRNEQLLLLLKVSQRQAALWQPHSKPVQAPDKCSFSLYFFFFVQGRNLLNYCYCCSYL